MAAKFVNKHSYCNRLLLKNIIFRKIGLRTFLSDAYACEEAWQKRLDNPLLKNIKMSSYFIEVDKKFQTKRLASGVDIDMFANNLTEKYQLDELEHLLFRFRQTKRANEMMDSTHYAIVRAFLKFQEFDSLFRILRDRVDYGVFPDAYSYNLMMDSFLKLNRYRDAAEIAVLMMLQEDLTNPLSRILGIYSCQSFLNEGNIDSLQPAPVEEEGEESQKDQPDEDEDEEEVKYVRIPFLRNHWFDDHFDITDPKTLLGKALYLMGREEKNTLGGTYQLIGLGMQNKWEKASFVLDHLLRTLPSHVVTEEAIAKVKEMLSSIDDDETKAKWIKEFDTKFGSMQRENKVCSDSIADILQEAVKRIPELEISDIEKQKELFIQWEEDRKSAYEIQQRDIDREMRLKVIAEKKEELYWKEKLLFFFENEEQIMAELEKAEEMYKTISESKKQAEEDYVPPEIIKKKPTRLTKYKKLAMIKSLK